ncbi:MAG: hypothetical protein JWN28_526 [Candidatus Saccharibacteria bacterium]|nr:hypothetical protein [Candidatus Saccharibacteria bacterium]
MQKRWSMLHIQPINQLHRKQRGLTIVELLIVLVLMGILLPILFTFLVNTYKDVFYLDYKVQSTSQTKLALSFVEDNVRISSGFLSSVPSPYTDAYGPHDTGSSGGQAWSYKGDSATSRVLISESYATNSTAFNSARRPIYVNTAEFNCTTQMYYQPQLSYISIYYLKNSTLYRRVLTDTTTALCAGNTQQQKQSCPPYITSGRDASCQANDEVLMSNVTEFTVEYFEVTIDGTSTQIDASYTSSDPTVLDAADYANVTITSTNKNGAVTNSLTQRMTKVNS